MSNFCSRSRILLFYMCFGIRISSPFHLATQIVSIRNLKCPKNAKNKCTDMILSPLYEVKLSCLCWLKFNKEVAQSVFLWFIQQDVGRWYKWIWIRMLNAFHIHGREFCKYGRAQVKFHIYGRSFQTFQTCPRMRF